MSTTAEISEPASELEHLIAGLPGLGPPVFVFGDGLTTAHLKGVTTPLFRGLAGAGGTPKSAARRRAGR
jgi:hypothetical protein